MTTTTLQALSQCTDVAELQAAVRRICAPFGPIQRLDILTSAHEDMLQAICFLRLGNRAHEQALMASLGVGRFGGEIVFVVDLPKPLAQDDDESFAPSSQWADWGDSAR